MEKEEEFKLYQNYVEAMFGREYMRAIAKLSVPSEKQYDANGRLRTDLYLTEKESAALKYALPYLMHVEKTHVSPKTPQK